MTNENIYKYQDVIIGGVYTTIIACLAPII